MKVFLSIVAIFVFYEKVDGHASLLEPPARNVLYRRGFPDAPYHADDDYLVCVETDDYSLCPPCGDTKEAQYPRAHEAGGLYANGIITRSYSPGQVIDIYVNVTNSHGGYIELKLCPNNNIYSPVDPKCLDLYPLQVAGKRTSRMMVTAPYGQGQEIKTQVKLPDDLTCTQCVMQMSFNTDQYLPTRVLFRNCADFEIVSDDLPDDVSYKQPTTPAYRQPSTTEYRKPSTTEYRKPSTTAYRQPSTTAYKQPPRTSKDSDEDVAEYQREEVDSFTSGIPSSGTRKSKRGQVENFRSGFHTRRTQNRKRNSGRYFPREHPHRFS